MLLLTLFQRSICATFVECGPTECRYRLAVTAGSSIVCVSEADCHCLYRFELFYVKCSFWIFNFRGVFEYWSQRKRLKALGLNGVGKERDVEPQFSVLENVKKS
ncbi:hypothetical protein DPMN_138580 [Dreissena polymorpha]|uniref:Secreted protein n=1 Tax=Dreissena polymorpha TaxID=45954 RepID=A0A9D4G7F4_DREPO|nr:hypothetical protein DPMN_138580 [Dreissena polymorpha]